MTGTAPELLSWTWDGHPVDLEVVRSGTGPTLLMLPALSSISTVSEMASLQERLSGRFSTVAVDWPGFGARPRPALPLSPKALQAFLGDLLDRVTPRPLATIAAGHGAGHLLEWAAHHPGTAGRLILVAPTWRGPLPTMTGARPAVARRIVQAGDWPALGQALYRLNVNRPMVGLMAREHVYADPRWLSGERLARKLAVVDAKGARHASIRFVTGALDPFASRAGFLAAAGTVIDPILTIFGADTPRKSKAEMDSLAALPHVRSVILPRGKLAVHEEEPDRVAEAIEAFLP